MIASKTKYVILSVVKYSAIILILVAAALYFYIFKSHELFYGRNSNLLGCDYIRFRGEYIEMDNRYDMNEIAASAIENGVFVERSSINTAEQIRVKTLINGNEHIFLIRQSPNFGEKAEIVYYRINNACKVHSMELKRQCKFLLGLLDIENDWIDKFELSEVSSDTFFQIL